MSITDKNQAADIKLLHRQVKIATIIPDAGDSVQHILLARQSIKLSCRASTRHPFAWSHVLEMDSVFRRNDYCSSIQLPK